MLSYKHDITYDGKMIFMRFTSFIFVSFWKYIFIYSKLL